MIRYEKVNKTYQERLVLEDIDLEINKGELVVLVGPSGSGKTTLLKMLNALILPTSGNIFLDKKALSAFRLRELRLEMGYVLQQIALFPNLTVLENLSIIPKMKKWKKETIEEKATQLLERVGMPAKDYLHRYPHELSGGQQQRVGILRAMMTNPKILLMDEPFSALDAISRKQLQKLLLDLHDEFSQTTVFVTHDTDEALLLADKIVVLNEGKIVQIGNPEDILKRPKTPFVTQLFGGSNA